MIHELIEKVEYFTSESGVHICVMSIKNGINIVKYSEESPAEALGHCTDTLQDFEDYVSAYIKIHE